MPRNTPVWFTATTSFQDSNDVSTMRSHRRMPALLIRMSTRPWSSTTRETSDVPLRGVGHVVLHERAADLGRGLRALVGEHVGDEDRRTLVGEQPRLGRALPARAAGDDRHPPVELPHRRLPCSSAYVVTR